jgi:enamine deaminase RidA (YjgF/YER057c/UK114 family)
MSRTIINPADLHDPTAFGYSHTVATPASELVFVAGQYGSDASGNVTSSDFTAQLRRSFDNLGTALKAVGLDYRDVVQIRTHIVDHDADKLTALVEVVGQIWGAQPPAQTLIGVASLALPDMLFEVDAIAARP